MNMVARNNSLPRVTPGEATIRGKNDISTGGKRKEGRKEELIQN